MSALVVEQDEKPTTRLYLEDTYKLSGIAFCVLGNVEEDGRGYVILSASLFHPQGGGQPSDVGKLIIDGAEFNVEMVKVNAIGQIIHNGIATSTDFFSKCVEGVEVQMACFRPE